MNVLVLGIGNILMTDEGAGVHAVEELKKRFRLPEGVEVLDGGTSGLELLPHIANRDCLMIVDAVRGGKPPGSVMVFEDEEIPASLSAKLSPHQIGLSDLLFAARLKGELPKRIVLFGIEPGIVRTGLGLSEAVRAGMDGLLEAIAERLRRHSAMWGGS